jgi:hypothetical protein
VGCGTSPSQTVETVGSGKTVETVEGVVALAPTWLNQGVNEKAFRFGFSFHHCGLAAGHSSNT